MELEQEEKDMWNKSLVSLSNCQINIRTARTTVCPKE